MRIVEKDGTFHAFCIFSACSLPDPLSGADSSGTGPRDGGDHIRYNVGDGIPWFHHMDHERHVGGIPVHTDLYNL